MARKEKIRPPSQIEYPQITSGGFRFFQQIAERLNHGALFVPRGDPSAADWVLAVLSTDGAYHTLNVSAIVKCVATAIYVRLGVSADTAGRILTLRKLGNSNQINILRVVTQVAGVTVHVAGIVPITLAGDFEYNATSATWDSITIEVCGWFV